MSLNEAAGWAFLCAGAYAVYADNYMFALGGMVLAKLCWIHDDMRKWK